MFNHNPYSYIVNQHAESVNRFQNKISNKNFILMFYFKKPSSGSTYRPILYVFYNFQKMISLTSRM